MPDPLAILMALGGAFAAAAAVLLLCGLPWRAPRPERVAAGWALGVGLAFLLGCWLLGYRPHSPFEDQDRFLLLLVPAVLGVEILAAFLRQPRWPVWLLRLVVALAAARVLLDETTYLSDRGGPGTREWSPGMAWLILAGLGAALALAWTLLALLARRAPGRALPLALMVTIAGSALVVMLSGYSSGGQLGLPLAAGLAGATAASLVLAGAPDVKGAGGVGVVGLFALLVMGRFFGQLPTLSAILLFGAPLLCWLPELPYVRRLGPWPRGLIRIAVVSALVVVVVVVAQQKFVADAQDDYLNYGK